MNKETLEKYKKIYTDVSVDTSFVEKQWKNACYLLPERKTNYSKFFSYGSTFAIIALVLIFAVVVYAQNLKPGNNFYALKKLSNNFSSKVGSIFNPENIKPSLNPIIKQPTLTPSPTASQEGEFNSTPTPFEQKELDPIRTQKSQEDVKGTSTQASQEDNSNQDKNKGNRDNNNGNRGENNGNNRENNSSDH